MSYGCSKSEDFEILSPLPKIRAVTLSIMSFGFRNSNSLKTTLLAKSSLSFGHDVEKLKMRDIFYPSCIILTQMAFVAIFAVLSRNLSCRHFALSTWRKT